MWTHLGGIACFPEHVIEVGRHEQEHAGVDALFFEYLYGCALALGVVGPGEVPLDSQLGTDENRLRWGDQTG